MKRYTHADTYDNNIPSAITIGTFDGVHIGHRKIIDRLIASSKERNLESTLLTFFPHPRMVLQKDTNIKLIHTIDERIQILEKTGLDNLVIHPFTKEFSRFTAQEYVKDLLVDQLNAKSIIIGYDHRFGRNRAADISTLHSFGETYNFAVEEIPQQDIENVAVSSTKIRKALSEGNIKVANNYLGDNFMLTGKVIKGKELGRTLNYPTANIYIKESYKLIPKQGVYVIKACIDNKTYFGMMNIGTNPTVENTDNQRIEAHFFDTTFNLYDKCIQVEVLEYIREEQKFSSLDDLKTAMQHDEDFSRDFINSLL